MPSPCRWRGAPWARPAYPECTVQPIAAVARAARSSRGLCGVQGRTSCATGPSGTHRASEHCGRAHGALLQGLVRHLEAHLVRDRTIRGRQTRTGGRQGQALIGRCHRQPMPGMMDVPFTQCVPVLRRRNPGNPEFASPRSGTRTFRCLPSLPRSACFGACPGLPVPACPPDPTRFVLGKLLSPLSGNSHLTLPAEHPACVARNGVNRNAIRRRPLQVRIPSRGRRFRPYRVRGEHRGRCWPAQRRGACLARCCR